MLPPPPCPSGNGHRSAEGYSPVDYEACKYIRMADGCSVDIYHWDIIVALACRINTFYAHAFRQWLKETATREKDKEAHQAIIIPLWTFGNN